MRRRNFLTVAAGAALAPAIARAQGVATGTVGTRIMRARAQLLARFAMIGAIGQSA